MRALLFLLSALILLEPTDGVEYDALAEHDRNIVDEAIIKANEEHGKHRHLDFYTILRPNVKTLNVLLRSTTCKAPSSKVHQKNCQILNNAIPQVSCVACHTTMSCFRLIETDEINGAINTCASGKSVHRPGATHIMYQNRNSTGEIGCLGCI